jgi:hypothetical protein
MDLKQLFGHKYLVTMEESWTAETPENRAEFEDNGDRWRYYELKGKSGMVYPYSETQIAVVLPTRAARRLMKLMGSELVLLQHADDLMCFKADAKHAAAIVRFIKPKRLGQLSEAHKAILSARLAANRYRRGQPPTKNGDALAKELAALPGAERRPLGEPHVEFLAGRPL